jgi:hypothetical protein
MAPPTGTAARAALVDRADRARAALVRVLETGGAATSGSSAAVLAWHRAQIDAQTYLRAYQAAVGELDRRDRLARRVAGEWLEAAVSALWYRVAEAHAAEELARDYLYRLPLGTCPRTAAREIARAHQFAIATWLAEHRDELERRGAFRKIGRHRNRQCSSAGALRQDGPALSVPAPHRREQRP